MAKRLQSTLPHTGATQPNHNAPTQFSLLQPTYTCAPFGQLYCARPRQSEFSLGDLCSHSCLTAAAHTVHGHRACHRRFALAIEGHEQAKGDTRGCCLCARRCCLRPHMAPCAPKRFNTIYAPQCACVHACGRLVACPGGHHGRGGGWRAGGRACARVAYKLVWHIPFVRAQEPRPPEPRSRLARCIAVCLQPARKRGTSFTARCGQQAKCK